MTLNDPFPDEPQGVEVDTLIERADLGPECFTLIAAGDAIPSHLAHLPTRPAAPRTAKRTKPKPAEQAPGAEGDAPQA